MYAGLNVAAVQNVKKIMVNVNKPPEKTLAKNHAKKLTFKEQSRMQRVLLQAPVPKKKPSLLSVFLDQM